ncbi:MAG: hypothetical protein KAH20_11395 [Methylococcales bacterium]|nr:hypothetical protein [Methylococcales bacterium]
MKTLFQISHLALLITVSSSPWAVTIAPTPLSPPNITTNIPWNAGFGGVSDIEAAYNNGRRQEETQLGIAVNTLGTLDLPVQATWDIMTDDAKALLILNEERQDRAGMQADVIGFPFAGIESHVDNITKNYGDLLHDTDTTGHSQPSGDGNIDSPFIRINQDLDIGSSCHEFLARAENLAYFAGSGNIPLPLERAIYNFIYDDANSGWGHREAALLQQETLSQVGNLWGFNDNNTSSFNEGFLGVYVRSSSDYKPFGSSFNYGSVVVLNIFDPVQTPTNCHYNPTLDHTEVNPTTISNNAEVPTLIVPDNTWMQIGVNTAPGTGSTVTDILADDITGVYNTDWAVYRYQTSINDYQLVNLTDTMLPGVGYWLIQKTGNPVTIDMPNSSSGVYVTYTPACSSLEGCFEIPLQVNPTATQWQMVSYPFRTSRDINLIKIVTTSGNCSTGCTLSEAADEGLVSDRVWHYDTGSYPTASTLDPWDGAWIAILPAADGLSPKMLIPATSQILL